MRGGLFTALTVTFAFGLFFVLAVALPHLRSIFAGASVEFLLVLAVHVVGALAALIAIAPPHARALQRPACIQPAGGAFHSGLKS